MGEQPPAGGSQGPQQGEFGLSLHGPHGEEGTDHQGGDQVEEDLDRVHGDALAGIAGGRLVCLLLGEGGGGVPRVEGGGGGPVRRGAQGQGAELPGGRGAGGRRGARGAEADALPGRQRDVGDRHMAVAGPLGPPDDPQFDAQPVDDECVAHAHAVVGELGGHHHGVRRHVGEAFPLVDGGGEEGAGLDAESGEIDLGAAVRRAAGDGDPQRGRLGVRVLAPGGGGLLVEETAGELVGPRVRGEDQL